MTYEEYMQARRSIEQVLAVRSVEILQQCEDEFARQICFGSEQTKARLAEQRQRAMHAKIDLLVGRERQQLEAVLFLEEIEDPEEDFDDLDEFDFGDFDLEELEAPKSFQFSTWKTNETWEA